MTMSPRYFASAQMAYTVSANEPLASTATTHSVPNPSGRLVVTWTGTVALYPPPRTFLPDGHFAVTLPWSTSGTV